jgi:hypothetical protein
MLSLGLSVAAITAVVCQVGSEPMSSEEIAKQLGLSVMTGRDVFARMPRNITTKDGKALLSWRVEVLPFAEQQTLFKLFNLKEPWDSETNKPLLEKGLTFYRTQHAADEKSTTWKLVPELQGGIMLVEGGRGSSVPWSQPDEVKIDAKNPLASFGEEPDGGYLVVLADGRVQRIDAKTLKERLLKKN